MNTLSTRVRSGNGHVAIAGPSTQRIRVISAQALGHVSRAILCRGGVRMSFIRGSFPPGGAFSPLHP